MKKTLLKITSISLAFLVLFSTLSFTVEKHYCGDFLVDVSYVGHTDGCGMEMDALSKTTKKSCCKDEIHKIEGQHELQQSADVALVLKGQPEFISTIKTTKDLFQEISIQLWKAYPKFRGESKFSTWMYRVGLNTSITLYRKSLRRVESQSIESVAYKISQEEYDDLEDEQLKLIYAAIHRLNDIEKGIIFLYLENKNYREISETLGISEVNARVRMNRIKTKLKTQLTS